MNLNRKNNSNGIFKVHCRTELMNKNNEDVIIEDTPVFNMPRKKTVVMKYKPGERLLKQLNKDRNKIKRKNNIAVSSRGLSDKELRILRKSMSNILLDFD
tara:strand:+ start:288 stop:587 length:300 start_codon:yes stop_codon:yes gene_type:complete